MLWGLKVAGEFLNHTRLTDLWHKLAIVVQDFHFYKWNIEIEQSGVQAEFLFLVWLQEWISIQTLKKQTMNYDLYAYHTYLKKYEKLTN